MHVQIRRYVTGLDVAALDLNADPEWSGWLAPMTLWAVASVAGAVLFASIMYLLREPAPQSPPAGA
jgi:hypothetical protein